MKKLICEVFVDEEMLKECYCTNMEISEEEYDFGEAFNGEFGWLDESGIFLEDWKVAPSQCVCQSEHFNSLNQNTVDYSGIEIAIHKDRMLRVRTQTAEGICSDVMSINYCPICGRRL